MVAAVWGQGDKYSFGGTHIEVAASQLWLLWRRRISVTVWMRPRRYPTSLWLRRVATDLADSLSLRVRFPVPWNDSLEVAFEETRNLCAGLSIVPELPARGSLPGCPRLSLINPLSHRWRWPEIAEYAVSVLYKGDRYDFSGVLVLPEPEAAPSL